jgi:alanine dehydrogenase
MERLRELDVSLAGSCSTAFSSPVAIEAHLPEADLVIGAVLVPGARAPRVLTREHLGLMKANAIVVDVSIDQGGCFESSHPTTHSDPTYEVDGILHYCVANMPGAVPITSTWALTSATLPYVLTLANLDLESAVAEEPGLAGGVSIVGGHVTNPHVAQAAGESYTALSDAMAMDLAPTPSGAV